MESVGDGPCSQFIYTPSRSAFHVQTQCGILGNHMVERVRFFVETGLGPVDSDAVSLLNEAFRCGALNGLLPVLASVSGCGVWAWQQSSRAQRICVWRIYRKRRRDSDNLFSSAYGRSAQWRSSAGIGSRLLLVAILAGTTKVAGRFCWGQSAWLGTWKIVANLSTL